jgi:hypothetical protein
VKDADVTVNIQLYPLGEAADPGDNGDQALGDNDADADADAVTTHGGCESCTASGRPPVELAALAVAVLLRRLRRRS